MTEWRKENRAREREIVKLMAFLVSGSEAGEGMMLAKDCPLVSLSYSLPSAKRVRENAWPQTLLITKEKTRKSEPTDTLTRSAFWHTCELRWSPLLFDSLSLGWFHWLVRKEPEDQCEDNVSAANTETDPDES